ncbi:hypothetical protein D3C84_980620 [compost metagenome]
MFGPLHITQAIVGVVGHEAYSLVIGDFSNRFFVAFTRQLDDFRACHISQVIIICDLFEFDAMRLQQTFRCFSRKGYKRCVRQDSAVQCDTEMSQEIFQDLVINLV